MIDYSPLWKLLKKKGLKKVDLLKKYQFSNTMVYGSFTNNRYVDLYSIEMLCQKLKTTPSHIFKFVSEEKAKRKIRKKKKTKISTNKTRPNKNHIS